MEPDLKNGLSRQTGESISLGKEEYWEESFHKEMLRLDLQCSNRSCNEVGVLVMAGELYPPDEHRPEAKVLFKPEYINPSPLLFNLEKEYPEEINSLMKEAFSLFWSDPASCGNKVRVGVEALLNDLQIDKERKDKSGIRILSKKGRPTPIVLHNRLDIYGKKGRTQRACANVLESIKWLGNESSHAGMDIHQGIVYRAVMVFGDVLACIYKNIPLPKSTNHSIEHINFWYHPYEQATWPKPT
ncbi:MAG: DUF4145 domain-containing protein [Paraglaciecola chathamensis]